MLLVEGSCNLYDFLEILHKNKKLMENYENLIDHKSLIFNKIKPEYIEQLLSTPIIIYLKKNSIYNNSFNSNLSDYVNKIEHIDNPELIIFLDKIEKSDRKSLSVKWVALELNEDIDFNLNKLFKEFVYLDTVLDENSSNGRIDINNYENRAKKYLDKIEKKYLKQFRGFFMKNLFKIQLASDKRTYFKKEMKQILDFEEELEKHNKKYFKIECLLCKQSFVVSTKIGAKNVLKPKDIFEFSEDKSRINLKCDHKNAISVNDYKPYTGNVMFSFKPIFDINQNKIDDKSYSYALIQYFYNFDISEDWKEIKYLDKNNQVTNFRVEDYIIQRENVEK
ncbi:hypothetical protein N3114_12570 (plasmid) [Aliarcobacter butzleri]|uniref:DUF4435 domain-containing protein n=1 Tax=Arcobacter porcinus TaxID=1935204 RepID=A0ABX2YA45_9BACT|nr:MULTISPECIES: hypothetical protein [Arcobacteraceae]OCL89605.1 hypothetical protein AAX28_02017 [Arcobacter porcinus]UWY61380.1 hypothetical protein N3115_11325 [Aliarcobacter butzleri]UXC30678.1 hypothetical protein N3114_12570 [Aliarcobacter butzleri]